MPVRRLERISRIVGIVAVLAATLPAAWAGPGARAAAPPPAQPPFSAHAYFDSTRGSPSSDIPVGGRPQPLRQLRVGVGQSSHFVAISSATTGQQAQPPPPDPEVLGFASAGEITTGAWRSDLNFSLLSTIAYFGVNMNGDGSLARDTGYQGWLSSETTALMDAAHRSGDRVVLTVKAFDAATIASIVDNPPYRTQAVATIVSQLQNRGGDGVNIDFEGGSSNDAANFTAFMKQLQGALHAQVPDQSYLTVDTYASAPGGGTLYDIGGLRPYVDAFDVMAYDNTSPNSSHAGPNAPLQNHAYSDTDDVNSYLQLVPASQIILGVPYYGYKWSVVGPTAEAQTTGTGTADTYSAILADFSCAAQLSRNWDANYYVPWATWYSPAANDPCQGNHNSWRELYYDDAQSLGGKYDLVNAKGLRGIGIWALGYDSGTNDLWNEIAAKFSVTHAPTPTMGPLPAQESSSTFTLSWSVPSGSAPVQRYVVFAHDQKSGWQTWVTTPETSATFYGFPGYTYSFHVEAFIRGGVGSGAPGSTAMASTTIAAAALPAPGQGLTSLYAVDAYGTLHPASSPPLDTGGSFSWQIVRGITDEPSGHGGLLLDGWGGLHPYGDASAVTASGYWPGWDIARGVAGQPRGAGGLVLDGWGGLHRYGGGPAASGGPYWPGWDIARGLALFADGTGGLVLDGLGALHPFTTAGVAPAPATVSAYWPNWDIARAVALFAGSTSQHYAGYVLDGWGGLHSFASQGDPQPAAVTAGSYWPGWDIARAVTLVPGAAAPRPSGYVVEGYGGFHPFGGASLLGQPNYGVHAPAGRAAAAA